MEQIRNILRNFGFLRALFFLSLMSLAVQLFPQLGDALHDGWSWGIGVVAQTFDVRTWNRTNWFVANIAAVLLLLALRFAPQLKEDYQEKRKEAAVEAKKAQKAQALLTERKELERLEQSRGRRIY